MAIAVNVPVRMRKFGNISPPNIEPECRLGKLKPLAFDCGELLYRQPLTAGDPLADPKQCLDHRNVGIGVKKLSRCVHSLRPLYIRAQSEG